MESFYLPALIDSPKDLKQSLETIETLQIHKSKGLLLILKNGIDGLIDDKKSQYQLNCQKIIGTKNLPLIIMASNLPLSDLDLFHQPERSEYHIKSVIDLAKNLPDSPSKAVTFHLNTLFSQNEWMLSGKTIDEKFEYFSREFSEKIIPRLERLSIYAKNKKIEIKIETTPVPEFGDRPEKELNLLINPYPLYSNRNIENIRALGIGICLDLSHTSTLYRIANQTMNNGIFEKYKGIFPIDLEYLKNHTLLDEVVNLQSGDIIHLNDGSGIYDQEKNTTHKEGLTLGEGEIKELPEIIKLFKIMKLKIVMEVNESDYSKKSNLKKSIDYFNKYYVD